MNNLFLLNEKDTGILLGILIPLISIIVISIVVGIVKSNNSKNTEFLNVNSTALKVINELNIKYHFLHVPDYVLEKKYDSEVNYNNVYTRDVLIYDLQYNSKKVYGYIVNAKKNKDLYNQYLKEIGQKVNYGEYKDKCNEKQLEKYILLERKLVKNKIQNVKTSFSIKVIIKQYDMGNNYITGKTNVFYANEIESLIDKVNDRNGTFFNNREIYEAIVRVERGKVSNKMRFSIYERDHYRCKKCGKKQYQTDLEIDHIIPISKGGKTEYNNLQTLCRKCNKEKGNRLDY